MMSIASILGENIPKELNTMKITNTTKCMFLSSFQLKNVVIL